MAAHMGERPQPIAELRPDTPAPLAELVMRCLEKEPDNRPQHAADLARVLETVTSSGTAQPAMPAVLLSGRGTLGRALAIYAAAFVVVAVLARAAIIGIGLPDWVFPGAVIVMALGLPVILATAYVHRTTRKVYTTTPVLTPGGSHVPQGTMATMALKAAPHLSWRRTAVGGVAAIGALVALTAAWMILRALGIGPAGSLMAAGKIGERERVLLADFTSPADDSTLGPTVTEAFRTDLAQSASLNVMPANTVREVLQRMQRPANTRVDYALAREIATREGMKAVIDGAIISLGGRYTISARLVSSQSGEPLATFSENATNASEIIPAISRLSRKLRERTGESLRAVKSARSLERVTTPSLTALQKYVAAVRALEEDGDWNRGQRLLEEAVAIDTGFAMAWRKLAVEMNNRFYPRPQVTAAIQKAYDNRDRLSESERYLAIAGYFQYGPKPDRDRIIAAYESLLETDSLNVAALNNLAVQLRYRREFARAEVLAERALSQQHAAVFYNNTIWSELAQGKLDEAEKTLAAFRSALPRNPGAPFNAGLLLALRGDRAAAKAIMDSVRRTRINEPALLQSTDFWIGVDATTEGRLRDGLRWLRSGNDAALALGNPDARLHSRLDEIEFDAWFLQKKDRARAMLESALREVPLDSIPAISRPYERLVQVYSLIGQTDRARQMMEAFDRRRRDAELLDDDRTRHSMAGDIALAEGRLEEALREFRAADEGQCTVCVLPRIARVYDLMGNADSAVSSLDRYVTMLSDPLGRRIEDSRSLAGTHKRLGELYEARGDREKAMSHYSQFVELWKNADAELQPLVRQARDRLAALQRVERR
jgi:tetratricopeptide (TPR) repeat protein